MIDVDNLTGDMKIYQGDSGDFNITNIPTDRTYQVYFSFYDENRKVIGRELMTSSINGMAKLFIPADITNLLVVPLDEPTATYYYGVKFCWVDDLGNTYEDTQIIGNKEIGELNEVTVYPKETEGVING